MIRSRWLRLRALIVSCRRTLGSMPRTGGSGSSTHGGQPSSSSTASTLSWLAATFWNCLMRQPCHDNRRVAPSSAAPLRRDARPSPPRRPERRRPSVPPRSVRSKFGSAGPGYRERGRRVGRSPSACVRGHAQVAAAQQAAQVRVNSVPGRGVGRSPRRTAKRRGPRPGPRPRPHAAGATPAPGGRRQTKGGRFEARNGTAGSWVYLTVRVCRGCVTGRKGGKHRTAFPSALLIPSKSALQIGQGFFDFFDFFLKSWLSLEYGSVSLLSFSHFDLINLRICNYFLG